MNIAPSTNHHSLPEITGYTILEQLYDGSRTAVYRAIQSAQQRPVVIKVLRQEYPSFGELVQFRNQYTIAKNLPIPGIVKPLSLEPFGSGYALVMEDFGGVALNHYAQAQALDLTDVLTIALQIADILQDLSQHHVVHKDIKPANILIHPESKQVKLIDFSIASLLPKETQEIQSPNVLEGTLAYLAPEQTGRMNRGVDYRADFYALGMTLYQLLSGSLPFRSEDPLELVHYHIAKVPVSVDQVNSAVPAIVAMIVSKLMAKNAEDRYQSAIGLKYDLQQCLTQWLETGEVLAFELGQRDLSDRFLIPEKLYGRENEVQTLLNAFDRVAQGSSELMLVAGFSGIGKTAIVNEVHKPITRQNGYFIKGKFDQFNRNIPLSAFVQSFRDLMGQLLSESDAQLQTWKTRILDALGDNGQVMIEVIPELEQIIGSQPPATELSGTAAQNRFNLLFQKFIQVFTTPEHPLVMFLDDLQWADLASLNLIQVLMAESTAGYLLLIGAYRDNEVFAAHPLMLTIDTLRKVNTTVNTIALSPLSQNSLNQLITDTLHCAERLAQPLTELVIQKTQGNPFFATQFLKALHQEHLITFDADAGYWQCDIVRVQDAALTDDVVKFMALQLQKLPEATQTVLKLAACIGAQFDLQTLAIVSQQSRTEVATALWKALQEGLILPQSEVYKFYLDNSVDEAENHELLNYKFLHDRIQQAAYSLIPEAQKQFVHLQIGQLLLANSEIENDGQIFVIINQLNKGLVLIKAADREPIARLNLQAGKKANASTAYQAALNYLLISQQLLDQNSWETQYSLSLEIANKLAFSAYLAGDFEQMQQTIAQVIKHAKSPIEQVEVYEIKIQALITQGEPLTAVKTALSFVEKFGVKFPFKPSTPQVLLGLAETKISLLGKPVQTLEERSTMTDLHKIAITQVLSKTLSATYISAPDLMPLLVFRNVNLFVKYGNTVQSSFNYSFYAMILCGVVQDIETGYKFGELALKLLTRFDSNEVETRVMFMIHYFIFHWKNHLNKTLLPLQESYQAGLEKGDTEYAAWAGITHCINSYYTGESLPELSKKIKLYTESFIKINQESAACYSNIFGQTIFCLLGNAEKIALEGELYSLSQRLPKHQESNDKTGLFLAYVNQAVLGYLFGDMEQARHSLQHARLYEDGGISSPGLVVFYFYDSLTRLVQFKQADKSEQNDRLKQLTKNQKKMKLWAHHAPMNYLHKYHLIEAERHQILGEWDQAIELYDQAISGARANEYIQEEALANELAAKFYLHRGKEKVAAGYMQEAYYCYAKWGAKGKTDDLEIRYPQLLHPILQAAVQPLNAFETWATITAPNLSIHTSQHLSNSSTNTNSTLDFTAILKASQSLAGTIQLDELLHQLTQIILQNSGGDRCDLILPNSDGKWSVAAIATPKTTELCDELLEGNVKSPVKLIQYVKNTQETVIIDDCKTELPVIGEYLNHHQPKSVLCLPILNQGHLAGILYLENLTTSKVFTNDRLIILNFLCTQAAISLENARLFLETKQAEVDLQQSNAFLKAQHESSPDGILVVGQDRQIKTFNQHFLDLWEVPQKLRQTHDDHRMLAFTADKVVDPQVFLEQVLYLYEHVDESSYCELQLKDGRTIERISVPVNSAEKESWGRIWYFRDISDRKASELNIQQKSVDLNQALLELQQSQTHLDEQRRTLRTILDTAPIWVWMVDLQGKLYLINHTFCQDVGIDEATFQSASHYKEILGELATGCMASDQACLEQATPHFSIERFPFADGTWHDMDITKTPLRNAKGEPTAIIGLASDATGRLQAQAMIQEKNYELAKAFQDLQQAQLLTVQSEKMASLGNLVAGVAHEINNPIGFLNGSIKNATDYTQDLLEHIALYQKHAQNPAIEDHAEEIDLEYLSKDLPKLLNSMKGAADRIKGISTSLRTFSRADTEHKVSANLHEGIDSTLLILKYRLKANEYRPEIQVLQQYGDLPLIQCFPGQLNQVFMNILANAVDVFDEIAHQSSFTHIEANPQILTIQTAITERNTVEIRIRDNGKGMPEDVKARIFDHLFTTKAVGKGTGLGLAIARQIVVEKHGGILTVQSELGQGTEFTIGLSIRD